MGYGVTKGFAGTESDKVSPVWICEGRPSLKEHVGFVLVLFFFRGVTIIKDKRKKKD